MKQVRSAGVGGTLVSMDKEPRIIPDAGLAVARGENHRGGIAWRYSETTVRRKRLMRPAASSFRLINGTLIFR